MNDNGAKIIELGAHTNMTIEGALALCQREAAGYKDVMVIAINQHDQLVVRSSAMARKDAFWLAHMAADHAMRDG